MKTRHLAVTLFILVANMTMCFGNPVDDAVNRHRRADDPAQPEQSVDANSDQSADQPSRTSTSDSVTASAKTVNCSCADCNVTTENCAAGGVEARGLFGYYEDNKGMVRRAFLVLIGITGVTVLYFAVRVIRTRRRQNRTKRYGVISTSDDRMEMTPLDQDDDDDEDLTVFEANGRLIK